MVLEVPPDSPVKPLPTIVGGEVVVDHPNLKTGHLSHLRGGEDVPSRVPYGVGISHLEAFPSLIHVPPTDFTFPSTRAQSAFPSHSAVTV